MVAVIWLAFSAIRNGLDLEILLHHGREHVSGQSYDNLTP